MFENQEQMITIYMSIMPEKVSDHLILKYVKGMTLDDMEEELQTHLSKLNMTASDKKAGKLRQVKMEDSEENDNNDEWTKHFDPSVGEYWLCTAVPAAKRRREEADDDAEEPQKGAVMNAAPRISYETVRYARRKTKQKGR